MSYFVEPVPQKKSVKVVMFLTSLVDRNTEGRRLMVNALAAVVTRCSTPSYDQYLMVLIIRLSGRVIPCRGAVLFLCEFVLVALVFGHAFAPVAAHIFEVRHGRTAAFAVFDA